MADNKDKKGFSYFVGSFAKVVFSIIRLTILVIWKVLKVTGLILPALYALIGVVLYLLVGFNPFLFKDGPMFVECVLYAIGFALSGLAALMISIKNLILKPMKNFKDGYKSTLKKDGEKSENGLQNIKVEEPKSTNIEKPKVYFSEMQNRLVHEYKDRFEVFIVKGKEQILEKVEYKIED